MKCHIYETIGWRTQMPTKFRLIDWILYQRYVSQLTHYNGYVKI